MESYYEKRQRLVSVFRDTMQKIQRSEALQLAVQDSIRSQLFIAEADNITLPDERYAVPAQVTVTKNRSFEAAAKYINTAGYSVSNGRVAVLNFASASNPGGGVETGASAQEESLCRVSTLYPCLRDKKMWNSFYQPHRLTNNPLHNDDIIYTKDVVVLKDDDYNDLREPFKADVITCAAPNLRETPSNRYNPGNRNQRVTISNDELRRLHEQRGRKILSVASQNGAEVVILGAFGCGAFSNDPRVVAQAYRNILPEFASCFRIIEFAVWCPPTDDSNYRVFSDMIGGL